MKIHEKEQHISGVISENKKNISQWSSTSILLEPGFNNFGQYGHHSKNKLYQGSF